MNINKFLDTKAGMIVTLAAVGAVAIYFGEKKAREAAAAVGNAVSPTNPNNIFSSGVDSVGASLTGNENFSLGGWIYDKINGTTEQQLANQQAINSNELAKFWQGYATQ